MKLVTSLCFAVSLFLAVNQRSTAQTQNQQGQSQAQQTAPDGKSQAQDQAAQSSALQQARQSWTSTDVFVGQDGLTWAPGITWMGTSYQGSGMSLAPADDVLRDHLKLPKGQGLVVTALDGNSPEAHAGIQLNDVLLKLGDIPLGKPEDLDESVKKMGENPVLLFLFRGGRQLKIRSSRRSGSHWDRPRPSPPNTRTGSVCRFQRSSPCCDRSFRSRRMRV